MTTTITAPVDDLPGVLLLPERPRRFGPKTLRLIARLTIYFAGWQLVATALVVRGGITARAVGLSMVFPGAGFLYGAAPMLFVVTLAALIVALVLWWGASAHVAIPLVWMASMAGAAVTANGTTWGWAVPVGYVFLIGTVGVMIAKVERRFRSKRALIPDLNAYLAAAVPNLVEPVTAHREPDLMDAELLRWCYAFAFQPDDGLDGLEWGEQFHSGTQLRYQLNSLAWGLSLYAANYLPNAPRRIEAALAKVVDKHTDLRVWKYWRALNAIGNFDTDPDPIRRDNIMFSAFLGDVINTYEAATGSARYDQPGSLTFVWKDGRTFEYDHHSLVAAVRRNFERSKLGFFPCEPGWSFTVCNMFGAQSLRGHDTIHGSDDWAAVADRWRETLDNEYLSPDGSYAHIRSNHLGISWDTGEVPGGFYNAAATHRFADILPDHARRALALDLRGAAPKMAALATKVVDGQLDLEMPAELERHRTATSALLPWMKVIGGARMAGHEALTTAAIEASARQCATGKAWPDRPVAVGGAGLGGYMMTRWSAPLSLAELNLRGYVAPTGPLVDCADDRVLITLAVVGGDGDLYVGLEPVGDAVHDVTLTFEQLDPTVSYRLVGDGAPAEGFVIPVLEQPMRLVLRGAR